MIEKIEINKVLYAIIIRSNYKGDGIEFYSWRFFSTISIHAKTKGYRIQPHIHKKINKQINFTQEVLFIKSGKLKVDFFDEKKYLQSNILEKGDIYFSI